MLFSIGMMMLSGAGADFCASRYPKKVNDGGKSNIDVSNWELTYPGKNSKAIQKDLKSWHNENFYSDDNGDLWFCVQEGGGHSGKTKDPRSELHEKTSAPLSKWKGWSQTAKLKVLNVSSYGGPVIGQIHSGTCGDHACNAALKLRFNPPKVSKKGNQIVAMFAKDLKNNDKHVVVADDVKLGDEIEYKIEVDFPNVKVTVNGKTEPFNWDFFKKEDAHFYFAAGNYCDTDNADHSDKGCLTVFSSLQTVHGDDDQELQEATNHAAAQNRRYNQQDCKGNFSLLNGDKMDECTPYLIPAPASILVNQTNETHYASYHFQGHTDCTGEGRLLSYWAVGECTNFDGYSQKRVWVDAPKPPVSACVVPGVCGRGYQACCIGKELSGDKCHCHLHNGTGKAAARDCGNCGNKFIECCAAFSIGGHACGCDVGDEAAVVV